MKGKVIKREMRRLCRRLLSIASVRRSLKSCPLSRTQFYRITRGLLCAMRAGGAEGARHWTWTEAGSHAASASLFGRVVVAIPAGAARGTETRRYESLMCIFEEMFLERGGRKDELDSKPRYSSKGAEDFCKTGLDGPRPILNLARDALEHQLQFC